MDEGPFGEYTGYYSGNKGKDYPKPVLRVKRILHRNHPVFCVQYHPEAAPGPHDSHYLFHDFARLIEENR